MSVYQDIDSAISVMKGNDKIRNHYDKVSILPEFSLKHFKKYKLENKNVLTYVNNMMEVFDLLSYGAKVTCFSSNRLDKYFLDLLSKMYEKNMDFCLDFILNDENHKKIFDFDSYKQVSKKLDDETSIFFDEIYDYCRRKNVSILNLIKSQKYGKETLERYIRTFIKKEYYTVRDNNKFSYWDLDLNNSFNTFKEGSFDFINLSVNIDNVDEEKLTKLLSIEEKYLLLLKANGKIQGFQSRNKLEIPNHKIMETRSIEDPNTIDSNCKKDYAYVYTK